MCGCSLTCLFSTEPSPWPEILSGGLTSSRLGAKVLEGGAVQYSGKSSTFVVKDSDNHFVAGKHPPLVASFLSVKWVNTVYFSVNVRIKQGESTQAMERQSLFWGWGFRQGLA